MVRQQCRSYPEAASPLTSVDETHGDMELGKIQLAPVVYIR